MKLHRLRTQRALTLEAWLHEDAPEYLEAEIRYLWTADLHLGQPVQGGPAYVHDGSPVRWDGAGYMWRTAPGKSWTLIGFRYHQACQWVRSKGRISSGTPRKRTPTLAEVLDAGAGIVGLVGAVVPIFRR